MHLFTRQILRIATSRLLVSLLLATVAGALFAHTALAQGSVSIVVAPNTQTVEIGETFTIQVEMQAGSTSVNGADVNMTFDPSVLQFNAITNGSDLNLPLTSEGSNSTGTIRYVAAKTGGSLSGTFALFTVEFTALEVLEQTETTLAFTAATSAANNGIDVPVATVDGAVVVQPGNQPPIAGDQSVTTDEDTPVAIVLTASDANGDPLTYTTASGPSNGTLSGTASSLTYTPDANFNGTDSFTFTANDGSADSNVATVNITISAVNDVPTANDDAYATNEATLLTVDAANGVLSNDTDVENDALTAALVADVSSGTLTLSADGSFSYTPNTEFSGTDSFTYTASDGSDTSGAATVTIVVSNDNQPPQAQAQSVTTQQDTAANITLGATDPDAGDTLTFSIASGPDSGTLSGNAPNLVYTPNAGFSGSDSFDFTVSDGNGGTSTATVIITVQAVATGDVVLALTPDTINTVVGQTFDVEIQVQAGEQTVNGAAAYINYDSALLEVTTVTAGGTLDLELRNDNQPGELSLAYGTFSAPSSGTFALATVTFAAIDATTGTSLTFNTERPRQTNVTSGAQSVLDSTIPASIVIESVSISGSVTLQGRAGASGPDWSVPLTVNFYEPGTDTLVQAFTPTTDEFGDFVITGIAPGTYDIAIKNSHTVQNVLTNVAIVAGTGNEIDFGTLREGDANDDNFVDLLDFAILSSSFGTIEGDAGFDARADFNEDNTINLVDFSLLTSHFDTSGDTVPASAVQAASMRSDIASVGNVALSATVDYDVDDELTVSLHLAAGEQTVDAVGTVLTFNPAVLKAVDLQTTGSFDTVLSSIIDNDVGEVAYQAGKLGAPFPNGEFDFATVRFERLAEGSADLALSSNATALRAGADVLGEANSLPLILPDEEQRLFLPLMLN